MLNWLRFEKRGEESASRERNQAALNPSSPDIETDCEAPLLPITGVKTTGSGISTPTRTKSSEGYRGPDLEIAAPVVASEVETSLDLSEVYYGPQRKRYRLCKMEHHSQFSRLPGFATIGLPLFIVLAVFILYPRSTAFYVDSFNIDEANSTYSDGGRLMTNWHATVGFDNWNFYPINIREVNVTAYLDKDRRAPIGTGKGTNLRFPARSRSKGTIGFQMPVYAPSTGLPSLIGECMTSEKVDLYLQAFVDLSFTHWSGRRFPTEIYATIDCKIPVLLDS